MGILSFFTGDNLNPKRIDFNKFGHIELDFSGNKLRFIDAMHTANFPVDVWPSDIDIYDENQLEKQKRGHYAIRYYSRGWNLKGKGRYPIGGVTLSSILINIPDDILGNKNLFNEKVLNKYIFEQIDTRWVQLEPETSNNTNLIYPRESSQLKKVVINNNQWTVAKIQHNSDGPFHLCYIPISKNHYIYNEFCFSAYHGNQFYSPENNIEKNCYDIMNEFMDQYFIELSPRSLKEKAEAEAS